MDVIETFTYVYYHTKAPQRSDRIDPFNYGKINFMSYVPGAQEDQRVQQVEIEKRPDSYRL